MNFEFKKINCYNYAHAHRTTVHKIHQFRELYLVLFCSLKDLDEFIQTADAGLNQPIKEGDYTGLVKVMGYVMAVKERQTVTDEMFDPLKETIELLKSYNQEMPEDVYLQLQVCRLLLYCVYICKMKTFASLHVKCM